MAFQSLINVLTGDDVSLGSFFSSFFRFGIRKEEKTNGDPPPYSGAHQWRRGAVSDVHDVRLPGPSDLYNILQTRSRQRLRL